ncbi:hypothetical protein FB451DRAFT_1171480 [Mycena latifolia]|nr:hypothetical protein FB451DRAFT_1171480 [Mycena latifolia]
MKLSASVIILAALLGKSYAALPTSSVIQNYAPAIQAAVKGGTFALQAGRFWPNEFSWSDKENAELFGATFLAVACKNQGGVVVIELSFETSKLQYVHYEYKGDNPWILMRFPESTKWAVIQRPLSTSTAKPSLTGQDPPADLAIAHDDSRSTNKPEFALPTQEQIDAVKANPKLLWSRSIADETAFLKILDETFDVVTGNGPFPESQKTLIADAGSVGLPPPNTPFNQVVVITDKGKKILFQVFGCRILMSPLAMKELKFVDHQDLPACLAEKQPQLIVALQKKKEAEEAEKAAEAKAATQKPTPRRGEAGDPKRSTFLLVHYHQLFGAVQCVGRIDGEVLEGGGMLKVFQGESTDAMLSVPYEYATFMMKASPNAPDHGELFNAVGNF